MHNAGSTAIANCHLRAYELLSIFLRVDSAFWNHGCGCGGGACGDAGVSRACDAYDAAARHCRKRPETAILIETETLNSYGGDASFAEETSIASDFAQVLTCNHVDSSSGCASHFDHEDC